MTCQTRKFGKAIRPLFADPVTFVKDDFAKFRPYFRELGPMSPFFIDKLHFLPHGGLHTP